MTFQEFESAFQKTLAQYRTIDSKKVERFGELVQGFMGVKEGDTARLIPFYIPSKGQEQNVIQAIYNRNAKLIEDSDFLGVSLVRNYIHYAWENKLIVRP